MKFLSSLLRPLFNCHLLVALLGLVFSGLSAQASAVTSITRQTPGPVVIGTSVVFRVTFNAGYQTILPTYFSLVAGEGSNVTGKIEDPVKAGSNAVWDVTVSNLSGYGSFKLNYLSDFTAGESYERRSVIPPYVTSISRRTPGPVVTGSSVVFRAVFDKAVTGVTKAAFDFAPGTGSTATGVIDDTIVAVSDRVYDVTVSSLSGNGAFKLNFKSGSAVSDSPLAFDMGQSYTHLNRSAAFSWGDGAYSQLGAGSNASSNVPIAISGLANLVGRCHFARLEFYPRPH